MNDDHDSFSIPPSGNTPTDKAPPHGEPVTLEQLEPFFKAISKDITDHEARLEQRLNEEAERRLEREEVRDLRIGAIDKGVAACLRSLERIEDKLANQSRMIERAITQSDKHEGTFKTVANALTEQKAELMALRTLVLEKLDRLGQRVVGAEPVKTSDGASTAATGTGP